MTFISAFEYVPDSEITISEEDLLAEKVMLFFTDPWNK